MIKSALDLLARFPGGTGCEPSSPASRPKGVNCTAVFHQGVPLKALWLSLMEFLKGQIVNSVASHITLNSDEIYSRIMFTGVIQVRNSS